MSGPGLIICAVSFLAGSMFTAKVGPRLGVIAFVVFLGTAISFYFALGWLPEFLDWTKSNNFLDPGIRVVLFSAMVVTPFFLGTGAVWLFGEIAREHLSHAHDQNDRSGK